MLPGNPREKCIFVGVKEKVHTDPVLGEVLLRKSTKARRVSIRLRKGTEVVVTVPYWVPYARGIAFLETRREWIQKALRQIADKDGALPEGEDVESLRTRAKAELPPRLKALADRYGFKYNRVTVKHNASNWGSCSTKGNINLNLNLVRVPVPLQDYILLHELTHLHHPDHGPAFHAELERLLADHFSKHLADRDFQEFLPAIGASRAQWRITRVLERALKDYRLL